MVNTAIYGQAIQCVTIFMMIYSICSMHPSHPQIMPMMGQNETEILTKVIIGKEDSNSPWQTQYAFF